MSKRIVYRREFLRTMGASAVAPRLLVGCGDSDPPPPVPMRDWQALADSLDGTVVLPDDDSFNALALPRNITYAHLRPEGIAVVASVKDVQRAVRWAVDQGIQPVARSPSGHSYGGYSMTTGLSIDTSLLNAVSYDENSGEATLGAGCRLGDASEVLASYERFIPIGRCPTVGVAGLALAGGFGFNSRRRGLTCDNLVETQIVDAKGELITCNSKEEEDLFWACRGGNGGTFGINTKFTFTTYQTEPAIAFKLDWDDPDSLANAFVAMQSLSQDAGPEYSVRLGMSVSKDSDGGRRLRVSAVGQYLGSEDDLRAILKPALDIEPHTASIQSLDFASATRFLSLLGSPNAFRAKSAFMDEGFDERGVAALIDWLQHWPKNGSGGSLTMFLWGGAINEVEKTSTAFVHRNGVWVVEGCSGWRPGSEAEVIAKADEWIQEGFNEKLRDWFNGSAFQNFIDPTLNDWEAAYFGKNFERLQEIKRKVDPDDVFHFKQSIYA